MSPRHRKLRMIGHHPGFLRFQPTGDIISPQAINLTVEELEAIRLKDLEALDQEEAAQRMGISRSTFQRVLYSARSKLAEALVEGKEILVKGGTYQVAMREFTCDHCGHTWPVPFGAGGAGRDMTCPQCGSSHPHRADLGGHGQGSGLHGERAGLSGTASGPGHHCRHGHPAHPGSSSLDDAQGGPGLESSPDEGKGRGFGPGNPAAHDAAPGPGFARRGGRHHKG